MAEETVSVTACKQHPRAETRPATEGAGVGDAIQGRLPGLGADCPVRSVWIGSWESEFLTNSTKCACFPGGSVVKNLPGSGRPPGVAAGNPLQYSCLKNPMARGAWRATVHGAAEESNRTERLTTTARCVWSPPRPPWPAGLQSKNSGSGLPTSTTRPACFPWPEPGSASSQTPRDAPASSC